MSEQTVTVEQMKAAVVAKALQDDAFRQAFVASPQATFESLIGTALPPNVKLSVVEEGPDTYVVVLPHAAGVAQDGELSDGDLEAVAGGSKSGAKQFFNNVGSTLGVIGAAPALVPVAVVSGKPGDNWGDRSGEKIISACGMG